jgi:hypothetical protein
MGKRYVLPDKLHDPTYRALGPEYSFIEAFIHIVILRYSLKLFTRNYYAASLKKVLSSLYPPNIFVHDADKTHHYLSLTQAENLFFP